MAKKKAAGQLSTGTKVRVKSGVSVPEFPDVSCAGWTGRIVDITGKKAEPKYVIEWDEPTQRRMPPSYMEQCEAQNLLYSMACLSQHDFEPTQD